MDMRISPRPLDRLRSASAVRWEVSQGLTPYAEAVARMEREAEAIARGDASELVWLLEHPPLYTAGTSAKASDLLEPARFPVHATGRGGQYTYHGPGQRVAYVMLNLKQRGQDVRLFVSGLEQWLIAALAEFGVTGERREDRVGIWVRRGPREDKIAALGIRLRQWVSFHGVSLNVSPDLSHFSGIVPCGVADHGVTSLADLGLTVAVSDVDAALQRAFLSVFSEIA
jgi:lipoyl(octanoyl) transferase